MFFSISRCYDSHMHLLYTGQIAEGLDLSRIRSPLEIKEISLDKHYFRGTWLVGFGWDQHKWIEKKVPTAQDLDNLFSDFPVALTRADGHALWVNSYAKKLAGITKEDGVFLDSEMAPFDKIIPAFSREQKRKFIITAINKMNRSGFTHIRDMSGDREQWEILHELEKQNLLSLYVVQNFYLPDLASLDQIIFDYKLAKDSESTHLTVGAIKLYYDGALGSQGALISQDYPLSKQNGLRVWHTNEFAVAIKKIWEQKIPIAVHSIGDLAAKEIIQICHQFYKEGLRGELHIEHGEVIDNESIKILSQMDCTVHMQPCHYLSDRLWLKDKLGSLFKYAFPWRVLSQSGIKIFWGSDTPIEEPSVLNNLKALQISREEGIPAFIGDPYLPHSFPNADWGSNCYTNFNENGPLSVVFDGKKLF